jgi:predicted TIM-barrel fold metal-dependent hydrolase
VTAQDEKKDVMDILDCQIHLGPGHIDETLAAMDALGIAAAVVDEFWLGMDFMPYYPVAGGAVRRPTTPTAELAALTHPDRFSYLVRVDRNDPEMAALIRLAGARPQARALRIAPGLTQAELTSFAEGGYDALLSIAQDSGFRVVFVAIPGHAPAMKHVLEAFPGINFVVDHCGMPSPAASRAGLVKMGVADSLPPMADTSDDKSRAAEFEKVLRLADAHTNVGLKWAHAQRMFGVSGYPFPGLQPYLRQALDRFGPERVMWASDASANRTGETWAELLFWLVDNPILTASERARLLGGTAREWLGWET